MIKNFIKTGKVLTVCLLLTPFLLTLSVRGQETAGRAERGSGGKGTQAASGIDNINLQNGNVALQIPLASLPSVAGGKLSYSLNAYYTSKPWSNYVEEQAGHVAGQGCDEIFSTTTALPDTSGGWSIGGQYRIVFLPATAEYQYLTPSSSACYGNEFYLMEGYFFKPVLVSPDGAQHEMRIEGAFNTYGGNREHLKNYYRYQGTNWLPFDSSIRLYTVDGSYITATYTPTGDYTIYLKDGTRVQPAGAGQQRITDPNNNSLLLTPGSARDEQTGREIKWSETTYNGGKATKIEYQTVGGIWQQTMIVWGMTNVIGKVYTRQRWDPAGGHLHLGGTCKEKVQMQDMEMEVVRQIILPATEQNAAAQTYSFSYNSDTTEQASGSIGGACNQPITTYTRPASLGLGELSEITLPSGAKTQYDYYYDHAHQLTAGVNESAGRFLRDAVKNKRLLHDGATDAWTYTVPPTDYGSASSMNNPDGSTYSEQYYPTDVLRSSRSGTNGLGGLTYRSVQSNKIMTEQHWTLLGGTNLPSFGSSGNLVTFNPVVDVEYTSLLDDSGNRVLMTAKKFQYDYNGELLESVEYDWFSPSAVTFATDAYALPTGVPASATVLRTTNHSYYNQAANASSSNAYP